ncbi:uncharacterized protein LOC128209399 [Mya arenaria]|uniref:uncharacterized protein LOC128209399 n=1 Tax=Mya arenaria TaxID=6604 RepID=UPI0022E7DA24|nr:uncharacterized protein LOC128209399 [Mya arenaria]
MVQSLVYNSSLFLEAQPFLAVMSQSVQYCLLDPLVSSGQSCPTDDHWVLRDYAARVLAHIVGIWGNSVNHLERYTEKTLREALHDLSRPFACHYGAVMGLMYLGTESVERVLVPHLHVYMPHLLAALEFQGLEFVQLQTNAWSVHGAILLCVEHVLQKYIKQFREENITDATNNGEAKKVFKTISDYDTKVSKRPSFNGFLSAFHKSPVSFYFEMFEYFGDALTLRLPEIAELKSHVFKPKERDLVTSISDPTADKSGEELLSELEEEVKREELMKKKQVKTETVHLLDRHQRDRERRAAGVRQQLKQRAAQQQKLDKFTPASDTDIEVIDVEGVDKLDFRGRSSLAISSACDAPGQGIKMTFAKRAKFTPDSAFSESLYFTEIKERDRNEENPGRKRKHNSPSPDVDFSQFLGGGIYPSSSFDSVKQRRRDPSFE